MQLYEVILTAVIKTFLDASQVCLAKVSLVFIFTVFPARLDLSDIIDQYTLVYPERSTVRFLFKVRTSGIEEDLVKFQFV